MKRIHFALTGLLICSACTTSTPKGIAVRGGHTVVYNASESHSGFHLPMFEETTLENGLRVLFIPDEKLPYINLSLLVKSGSSSDPTETAGLSSIVAELLDKGTAKRSATQIAQDLGNLGAEFEASATYDYSLMSVSGLSTQADALLANFSEIVLQPAFSDGEIERTKAEVQAQIQRRVDNPEAFADLAFAELVYGNHPYGQPVSGTEKTVREIKKKNIIQYYLRHYRPNNAILSVVGKYTPELKEKIVSVFGAWQKRDVPEVKFPQVARPKGIHILVENKSGLVQSQIRFGYPAIMRKDPDFLALRLANTILGGAFASRLNDRVRKELGLTYNIGSVFDARQDAGPFEIETFTKNESVGLTVTETLKVLNDFHNKGVTSEEVERTKGYLKGTFPAAIETPEKLAINLMLLRFYGIPDSYLTNYLHEVDRLSTSDINRVIQKHIDAQNIDVLVYSNGAQVKAQLAPFSAAPNSLEIKNAVQDED